MWKLKISYTETAPGIHPCVKFDKNLQVAMRVSSGTSKRNSWPSRYDLNSKIFRPITVSLRTYFCGTVGGAPVVTTKEMKRTAARCQQGQKINRLCMAQIIQRSARARACLWAMCAHALEQSLGWTMGIRRIHSCIRYINTQCASMALLQTWTLFFFSERWEQNHSMKMVFVERSSSWKY